MNVADLPIGRSRVAFAALACVVVTVVAFVIRFRGLDHLLPHCTEPDAIYALQPQMIRSVDRDREYSTYPLLVGYTVMAWPESAAPPPDAPLARHLEFASRPHFRARVVVACLSALIAPATWWLARNFVGPGWATLAALFAATSLMHVNFSQQARPHAPVTAALALALCAALRARRTGRTSDWWLASAATMLPIGLLQTGSFGYASRAAGSRLVVGSHVFDWRWFDGSGFRVLFEGVRNNDPVLLALAGVGSLVAAWAWTRRTAATPTAEAAIVAALFVPYVVVFGAYQWSLDRFAMVVIPVLALLAAVGMRGVLGFVGKRVGVSLRAVVYSLAIAAALGLPVFAASKLVWLRSRPDTLELTTRWVGAHLNARSRRLWMQPGYELPIPRSPEAVEIDRASYRSFTGFWWTKHQEEIVVAGPRAFDVRLLPDLWSQFWTDVEIAPPRTLATLGESLVFCAGFQEGGYGFKVTQLRTNLARFGRLVWHCAAIPFPRHDWTGLGYNNAEFLDDVLDARCVGPNVEIYALEPCE
jgi:hypothetical protein